MGIDLLPENGEVFFTKTRSVIQGKTYNDIMDVWLFHYDGPVSLENATTDEVAQTKWMTIHQIKELLDAGKLVESLAYFFTEIEATS